MTTKIEDELRQLFGTSAEGFEMDGALPPRVRRRARARAVRALSAVVAVAIVGGVVSVATLRGNSPAPTARSAAVPRVRLMDYFHDSTGADNGPDASALSQHAQCMRDQGFDVPDPVRTGDGWQIEIPQDESSSPAWREAEFVTCAMSKFMAWPAPGNLRLEAPTSADVGAFVDCMRAQGFDLPDPTQTADGTYTIDLSTVSFDPASDDWNRVLLTCAPPPYGPAGAPGPGPSGTPGD